MRSRLGTFFTPCNHQTQRGHHVFELPRTWHARAARGARQMPLPGAAQSRGVSMARIPQQAACSVKQLQQ